MNKMGYWLKGVSWILVVVLLTGCYGNFSLTKTLYQWNGEFTDNPFLQTAVMWVLGFFWIYSAAIFIDYAILNLVEFWTGENPVYVAEVFDNPDGTTFAMHSNESGDTVRMELTRDDEKLATRDVVRVESDQFQVRDEQGTVLGHIQRNADGDLILRRAGSDEERVIPAADLQQILAH